MVTLLFEKIPLDSFSLGDSGFDLNSSRIYINVTFFLVGETACSSR